MLPAALSLRYVLLIAVAGASIGACMMFWEGSLELVTAAVHVFGRTETTVVASVMEATDKFLFGVVLVVFAYSITFGFVFVPDPEGRQALPRWMRVNGVHELKRTFFEVILVYLVVDFVTDVAESENHAEWKNLVMPASILLLAAALRLLHEDRTTPHE